MKQLTKAEEEVMQLLWQLKEANVASIIDKMQNRNLLQILYQQLLEF